jgi:hypothetical protein
MIVGSSRLPLTCWARIWIFAFAQGAHCCVLFDLDNQDGLAPDFTGAGEKSSPWNVGRTSNDF